MTGRPTDYNQDILNKAQAYYECLPEDENLHSIEGLSEYIGIARSTVYEWIKHEGKEEFSDIVEKILARQGKTLINKGITGEFNSKITTVLMSKHNYRESTEVDQTLKGNVSITGMKIIKDGDTVQD